MWREDRVTTKRGRTGVPEIFLRTRTWRRARDVERGLPDPILGTKADITYLPFRPCDE